MGTVAADISIDMKHQITASEEIIPLSIAINV